ncbi:MAG: hypothetical protein K8R88_12090 [Armatimonadetes bacterium]|nr:hypothetical protein [Armatimonadota bacterium]
MKTSMVLALALVAGLVHAQSEDPKVDCRARCVRLDAILEDLSQKAGVSFKSNAELGAEILYLDIKQRPVSSIRETLAKILHAEWKLSDKVWRLSRTEKIVRKLTEEYRIDRAERLQKAIDKWFEKEKPVTMLDRTALSQYFNIDRELKQLMQSGQGTDQVWKKLQQNSNLSPSVWVFGKILRTIPAADLASGRKMDRMVFSLHPQMSQRVLNSSIAPTLQQHVDNLQFVRSLETDPDNQQVFRFGRGAYNNFVAASGAFGQAILVASWDGDNLDLTLQCADPAGKTLSTDGFDLELDPVKTAKAPEISNEPFKISESASEFLKSISSIDFNPKSQSTAMIVDESGEMSFVSTGEVKAGRPLPARGVLDKLLSPDLQEPLSYFVADYLDSVAKVSEVAVLVPDWTFGTLAAQYAQTPEASPNAILGLLAQGGEDIEQHDGLITGTPHQPLAKSYRTDRKALGQVLRHSVGLQTATLDQRADFAGTQAFDIGRDSLEQVFLMALDIPTDDFIPRGGSMANVMDHDALRIYGRLPAAMRNQLRNGGSIVFSGLPLKAQEAVSELVGLSDSGPSQLSKGQMALFEGASFLNERTHLMPQGVPAFAEIRLPFKTGDALQARDSAQNVSAMDPKTFAKNQLAVAGKLTGNRGRGVAYEGIRMGTQRKFMMTIEVAKGIGLQRPMSEMTFDPSAPFVSYENLPADTRASLDKVLAKEEERLSHIRIGGEGNGNAKP